MKVENVLAEKKAKVCRLWFDGIAATYPEDTEKFFKQQKDTFANPVGTTLEDALPPLVDRLISGEPSPEASEALDSIIRVRAVQNFTPSGATAFVLLLKPILRKILKKHIAKAPRLQDNLVQLEGRVDDMLLTAFDIFMDCRQQIYELKVTTERNKIYSAFSRAGLVYEIPDSGPEIIR